LASIADHLWHPILDHRQFAARRSDPRR
jgi:hypothetical protein